MPYVYQSPRCIEIRRERSAVTCGDARCQACYGDRAAKFEHCGDFVDDLYCILPLGHPEDLHEQAVDWPR